MSKTLNRSIYLFIVITLLTIQLKAQLKIDHLLTENLVNPLGIDSKTPRFTWMLHSNKDSILQTAYEIKVWDGKTAIWSSGKILSEQSVHVRYQGAPLKSGHIYHWQVKVWDNKQEVSGYSSLATFSTGYLQSDDWKAKWISPGYQEDTIMRPSPVLKKDFSTSRKIIAALAYITCHGFYNAEINGKKIGNSFFTPGWTQYNQRLQYQMYDVKDLLKSGLNSIMVTLGSGWYRGNIGWWGQQNIYGKHLALLYQMEIIYSDGTSELILSDSTWQSAEGKIRYAELYNGEIIDNNKEPENWTPVKIENFTFNNLVATINEPVKAHEVFSPKKIFKTPAGDIVADFGQNMAGFTRLKVTGKPGDIIGLEHGEILDKDGNFYRDNLRSANQQEVYILNGKGEETFEPHFTYHGFRYVRIKGVKGFDPTTLKPEQLQAIALYSDMPQTGTFECSDSLVNKLQQNIIWSQNSNFIDIPTDCPQRNERLGWIGDAQVFSRTATYNRQVNNFFAKWLKDLSLAQFPNGVVPFLIPDIFSDIDLNSRNGAAGWSDAVTIIPWNMFLAYGDTTLLANQYPSMRAWVDYVTANSTNGLWRKNFQFGDWLSYRSGYNEVDRSALTDVYLVAQAYYAYSTELLLKAAKVLNKQDDIDKYTSILQQVKDAFCKEYVTPNGRIMSNTQTSYVLALHFDILPEELRPIAAQMLADNVISYDYHLTTGFLGTPFLPHVLSKFGYNDIAYKLLLQQTYPSWLYPVKMGATTIWERWDGIKADSSFQIPDMNSFNHYSYGAIGDWMYRVCAGIETDESGVGYKKIKICPLPGKGLNYVHASLNTYYGKITVNYKIEDKVSLSVEIPANTTADIYIPQKDLKTFKKVTVGSGKYHFSSN